MNRIGADSARSPLPTGAAEVPGLRTGASVIIKALAPAADGKWSVLVNGVRLEASVTAALSPGVRYSALAQRLGDSPGWVFRIMGSAGEGRTADLLRASGLPGDPAAVLALHALMAESLSLDPNSIARLRAALLNREAAGERAELLARALAKGLDPEALADAVEAVGARAGAGGGEGGSSGAGRGQTSGSGDQDADASPEDKPPVWQEFGESGESGEGKEPASSLPGLLSFFASRATNEPNPYQLFNSRTGPRGRWIYAPYRFEREGVAFSGTLRILVPEGASSPGLVSADVLSENDRGKRGCYAFVLRQEGKSLRLSLSGGEAGDAERLAGKLQDLAHELSALGCSVDLVPYGSLSEREPDYRPVDDHA